MSGRDQPKMYFPLIGKRKLIHKYIAKMNWIPEFG
jgi:hypothetical protein